MNPTAGPNHGLTAGNGPKHQSIIELDAFEKIHSAKNPFFAVCTGPYRIEFRIALCGECGAESFVREYSAKILALKDATFPALSDDDRAEAGQMDSISLAMHVMNAGVWLCSRQPDERLGLSALHSALPKWVLHATSKVIFDLEKNTEMPFARIAYTRTTIGNKTLVNRCPSCEADLPAFQACVALPAPMALTLADDKGEPILYSWPVILSESNKA